MLQVTNDDKLAFASDAEQKLIRSVETARLPDGLFSYQKSQLGYILEGLIVENIVIFYGHL
jgi:hypothetical protein